MNNVNLKANSERNGAFSGDSSTNSKSFEGKVHLHRSSLSDSKDVAKLLKDVEKSHLPGKKLYIRTKNFQNWFGKWEKNEQLSSKIAVKTAFYNLYRILVQLWLKAKKTPCRQNRQGFCLFQSIILILNRYIYGDTAFHAVDGNLAILAVDSTVSIPAFSTIIR